MTEGQIVSRPERTPIFDIVPILREAIFEEALLLRGAISDIFPL